MLYLNLKVLIDSFFTAYGNSEMDARTKAVRKVLTICLEKLPRN
jgi:hypothetical protein